LSKNFYLNNGHVFKTKNLSLGKDSHAQGHALLLVGVMELPAKLHATQGRFCTIVANSWGEGWGKGGYACLSDAWFDQFRYNIPFLSVEKVSVI
jgi:C1A family cysteine protease